MDAVRGETTLADLARQYEVHPDRRAGPCGRNGQRGLRGRRERQQPLTVPRRMRRRLASRERVAGDEAAGQGVKVCQHTRK